MSEMTAEQLVEAQRAEYGKYVAKEDIYVGTALAFRAGDPVPASHVERGVVEKDKVVGSTTKAAAAVTTKEG